MGSCGGEELILEGSCFGVGIMSGRVGIMSGRVGIMSGGEKRLMFVVLSQLPVTTTDNMARDAFSKFESMIARRDEEGDL